MSEVDAVSLLRKVSGYEGDNAMQVIKSPQVTFTASLAIYNQHQQPEEHSE